MPTSISSKFRSNLKDFRQRPNFDLIVLICCAFVLGISYGLSRNHFFLEMPHWYSAQVQRFCVMLMIWTALTQTTAERVIGWTITDAVVISSPTVFGIWLPDLLSMELGSFITYHLSLGRWIAGATAGAAVAQAFIALAPSISNLFERNKKLSSAD